MRNFGWFALVIVVWVMLWSASCLSPRSKVSDDATEAMALIPAGEFEMTVWDEIKNQKSSRTVYVDDFYLDVYLVSNSRYARCVEEGAC